jgi:pyruvate/2-oxoglutarate dehydrogenase complex dihydrolipoamide dehydrogenase (E3) component
MSQAFDAIIIGAGQAGPPLAERFTRAGQTVAMIERNLFGGTCVNTGCMPTKTLVASAYAAHLAFRAGDYGVILDRPPRIDMLKVKARADAVSEKARSGVESWLRSMPGCTIFHDHAQFQNSNTIKVGDAVLTAPKIFINVGGRALVPDIPGLKTVPYLTNVSMLAMDHVPKHLIVLGGSYIGLEFAQMYRRFGAAVTVIEQGARLVPREDEDISDAIRTILQDEGIEILIGTAAKSVMPHSEGVAVRVADAQGEREIVGSDLLLAIGRRPNTDDLGLDKAGVMMDARGFIEVDDTLATNVPGIWALGDCNGKGAFTHTSYNDFEIVAANLFDGETRRLSQRILGYALYIDPPLGRAGLTEAQARQSGRPLLVAHRPMTRVGRAVEKGETKGFMKAIVDAETKKILGAAILGLNGDEAIHGILDIMNAGVPYSVLRWAVPIHPTVSELIPTLLLDLKPVE